MNWPQPESFKHAVFPFSLAIGEGAGDEGDTQYARAKMTCWVASLPVYTHVPGTPD